ncbi:MAG: SDR family oxidoreductase [Haloarculaceae archaeon]
MRVAILGCGYVGLALGRRLSDAEVFGVRRSRSGLDAVEAAGLVPVQADVTEPASLTAVPAVDTVVFTVSAGSRDPAAARATYVEGQRRALAAFGERSSSPDRYVYTSSTGVYGDRGGDWVDEETALDAATDRQRILAKAEQLGLEGARSAGMAGTVARLGGLYGPDRYRLERYLEGPVPPGYLNLCHRSDAAGAIANLLELPATSGEVVNVVDDEPVDRWTFADWLADACGEPEPPKQSADERTDGGRPSKRCSNDRLRSLGYRFDFPTFREGYRAAVASYRTH